MFNERFFGRKKKVESENPISKNPEGIISSPKRIEKDSLSEEQIQKYLGLPRLSDVHDLQRRIERVQGHVRMVVHPFFSKDRKYSVGKGGHEEAYANARKVIDLVLKKDNSSPVFLFEDGERTSFHPLPEGSPTTSLITLPTYAEIGIPHVEGIGVTHPQWREQFMTYVHGKSEENPQEAKDIFNRILDKSFDHLAKVFQFLGVKSLTASGMYLGLKTDAEGQASLEGCLGEFITELRKRNFAVDISQNIGSYSGDSKETLTELRNAGIEIKQTGKR